MLRHAAHIAAVFQDCGGTRERTRSLLLRQVETRPYDAPYFLLSRISRTSSVFSGPGRYKVISSLEREGERKIIFQQIYSSKKISQNYSVMISFCFCRTSALNPPTSTRVKDKRGEFHSFDVKVLGTEETWHNPSILLATLASSGGKVVFSQIHLEVDPTQYEYEEYKFKALKESNTARLEIISDLLSTHLGIETKKAASVTGPSAKYTHGYFLGKFEVKVL